MDVQWDDKRTKQIATSVGIVSSDGPHGPNAMAAEWTHQVSYAPALLMINVKLSTATCDNILASKEFGVSLAAGDQNILASIMGTTTGKEVDKIALLKKMGFETYAGKKIKALMIKGAAMNAECKLVESRQMGDRMMFLGEIVELSADESKQPVVYQAGSFWNMGEKLERPPASIIEEIQKLKDKYRKKDKPEGTE